MSVATHLKIDEELAGLIPALTDAEFRQLEANVLADGCRDPLAVWAEKDVLLDGHNRYRICQEHGLPFKVGKVSLADRLAARVRPGACPRRLWRSPLFGHLGCSRIWHEHRHRQPPRRFPE